MKKIESSFRIMYNTAWITVVKSMENATEIFTVYFSNEVPAIVLTSIKQGTHCVWNSLPPGNRELASAIGLLIEQFIREHPDWEQQEE